MVTIYGLTHGQAREAVRLGWDENDLRDLSQALRAGTCRVVAVAARALQVVTTTGRRVAVYPDHVLDVRRVVCLLEAAPQPVVLWTDGSGTRAQSAAGAGVLVEVPDGPQIEVAAHLGLGTNNYAELRAVQIALQVVPDLDVPLVIRTDSEYVHTVLTRRCRLNVHTEVIDAINTDLTWRRSVDVQLVKGHSGIAGNDRADALAKAGRLQLQVVDAGAALVTCGLCWKPTQLWQSDPRHGVGNSLGDYGATLCPKCGKRVAALADDDAWLALRTAQFNHTRV